VKTYAPKARDIERRWYLIDADGAVLGRLASEVAKILRGKHKPIFAPHADTGDHVIVVNARGVRLSGAKLEGKIYHRHSGYPGGLRSVNYQRLMSERPTLVVEKAVRGMLPKNRLGRKMIGKLAVYEGAEHPHAAQRPVALGLGDVPSWSGLPAPPEPEVAPEPAAQAEPKTRARRKTAPSARTTTAGRRRAPGKDASSGRRSARGKADAPKAEPRRSKAGTGRKREAGASAASTRSLSRRRTASAEKPATRSRAKPKKDEKES
jgi:large subunit ribosomal protein L13